MIRLPVFLFLSAIPKLGIVFVVLCLMIVPSLCCKWKLLLLMCFIVNSSPHNDSLRDISLSRIKSISFRLNTECSSMFTIMLTCEKWNDDDATLDNIKTSLSFIPGGMHTEMVASAPLLFCSVKFTDSCSIPKYAFSSVI